MLWGFDLSEARWDAFLSKNMYDKRWPYLRRERLIAYQLAQSICMGASIPATVSMSKYNHLQTHVQQYALSLSGLRVELHNNDIIAAEILTLTFCSFISTLFGLEFITLVLWPRRVVYPRWYNFARMIVPAVMTTGLLVAAIVSTFIMTQHSAFITGASAEMQEQYTSVFFRPPLKYNAYPANIACIPFLWLSWICATAATTLLIIGVRREMNYGTEMPPVFINDNDMEIKATNESLEESPVSLS